MNFAPMDIVMFYLLPIALGTFLLAGTAVIIVVAIFMVRKLLQKDKTK